MVRYKPSDTDGVFLIHYAHNRPNTIHALQSVQCRPMWLLLQYSTASVDAYFGMHIFKAGQKTRGNCLLLPQCSYGPTKIKSNDAVAVVCLCRMQDAVSRNAAVLVGSTAKFTCHTGSRRVCFIYRANISDSDKDDVCRPNYDKKFINRCNVTAHSTDGTHILTINDVRLSDAGFYSCGDCYTTKTTAHLLVLG